MHMDKLDLKNRLARVVKIHVIYLLIAILIWNIIDVYGSVQQNHIVLQFQFSNFLIFHELQRTSIKWFQNWTIHHKVIRH